MHSQQNNGFTLIELMIVIAIIATLAGIAIPIYRGYKQTAQATECGNEVAALRLAEEEFFLVNNSYFEGGSAALLTGEIGRAHV